jgi:allantoinase
VPLVLGDGRRRDLPLGRLAQALAAFPARRLRLPGKGRLTTGAHADLVLVDLTAEAVVGDLLYRHPHSPFVGRTVRARIVRTLLRGRTVYADGRIVGEPAGRLVIPDRQERP